MWEAWAEGEKIEGGESRPKGGVLPLDEERPNPLSEDAVALAWVWKCAS